MLLGRSQMTRITKSNKFCMGTAVTSSLAVRFADVLVALGLRVQMVGRHPRLEPQKREGANSPHRVDASNFSSGLDAEILATWKL